MRRVRGSSRRLFECGGIAGGPVQEDTGRPGGPVQNISVVGGGGGGGAHWLLWDLLESLKHHYAQETISLSNILWIT
jgi:hypothetical protein